MSSRLLTFGCENWSQAKSVQHLYSNIIFHLQKKNHCKPSPDLEWSRNIFSGTEYSYRFSIGWERGSVLETFLHAAKKQNQETIILWWIQHTTLWINDHYFPLFLVYSNLFSENSFTWSFTYYYNYYRTWAKKTKSIKADKESQAVETKIYAINVTSFYWKKESVYHIVTLLDLFTHFDWHFIITLFNTGRKFGNLVTLNQSYLFQLLLLGYDS